MLMLLAAAVVPAAAQDGVQARMLAWLTALGEGGVTRYPEGSRTAPQNVSVSPCRGTEHPVRQCGTTSPVVW